MDMNHLNTLSAELAFGNEAAFHVHYWGNIDEHYTHSVHKHSFFECCFVTRGEGWYVDNGTRFLLHQGDMFLSKPDVWHQIGSRNGIGLAWVAFMMKEDASSERIVEKYRLLKQTDRIYIPADSESASVTASLWRTLFGAAPAVSHERSLLEPIAYSLLRSFLHTFLDDQQPLRSASKPSESILLHKARLFIHDNLSLRIKFQDLAEYLHISERHLSRLFKNELGVSFSDYYRMAKLKTASSLLESTNHTLEQIAGATGFYSVHHFAKAFKEATGTTPGQWRRVSLNRREDR